MEDRNVRFQQVRRLTEVSRALTYAISTGEVLDLAVAGTAAILGTPHVALVVVASDGSLLVRTSDGAEGAVRERLGDAFDEAAVGRLRALLVQQGGGCFLGVPLVVAGAVSGVLAITRPEQEGVCEDDEWLLAAVADQAAVALEKLHLSETAAAARQRAEESLRLLSETSRALLGASLDYEATLASVAWLVVPRFADLCIVDTVDDDETICRRVAVEHLRSSRSELARDLEQRCYPARAVPGGAAEVVRTGRSQLHVDLSPSALSALALDAERSVILRKLGLRSAVLAPMVVSGRVAGVISFVRAGTQHRYDTGDLLLAEEIGRRAAAAVENARLYRQARDAIGVRDEFLSVASHELRTPLTTLQLQIESVEAALRRARVANEKVDRGLETARRQVGRLVRLVEDLLDVSRLSTGRLALDRQPVDLADLAHGVVEQFEVAAQAAGCTLVLHLPAGPVRGSWDPARIEQVISNLLSNALKYGAGQPVEVTVEGMNDRARFSVEDRGIGVHESDVGRIFDRFERAVTSRHYAGMGLGLFIARQLVEAHAGWIHVESRPGEGSAFEVVLPRGGATEGRGAP